MIVVGVRFKKVGKVYYFDPGGFEIPKETPVIVETAEPVKEEAPRNVTAFVPKPAKKAEPIIKIETAAKTARTAPKAKTASNAAAAPVKSKPKKQVIDPNDPPPFLL